MAARSARRVTRFVHVTHPKTGEYTVLTPGDEVPPWASKLVTNPKAFASDVQDTPPASAKESTASDGKDAGSKDDGKSEGTDGGKTPEGRPEDGGTAPGGTPDGSGETGDGEQDAGDEPPTFQP